MENMQLIGLGLLVLLIAALLWFFFQKGTKIDHDTTGKSRSDGGYW